LIMSQVPPDGEVELLVNELHKRIAINRLAETVDYERRGVPSSDFLKLTAV
jgi:hypothetical protein